MNPNPITQYINNFYNKHKIPSKYLSNIEKFLYTKDFLFHNAELINLINSSLKKYKKCQHRVYFISPTM